MEKKWVVAGLVLVILSIVLGAFGAHGLKTMLEELYANSSEKQDSKEMMNILTAFETGTKYQMYQGILFLVTPSIVRSFHLTSKTVFWMSLIGIILFSGSIYGLTYAKINSFN